MGDKKFQIFSAVVMLSLAVWLTLSSESIGIFISCLIGSCIALLTLFRLLSAIESIKLTNIINCFILIFYINSTFLVYFSYLLSSDNIHISDLSMFGTDFGINDLASALAYIYYLSFLLFIFSLLEPPVFTKSFSRFNNKSGIALLTAINIGFVYAYFSGGLITNLGVPNEEIIQQGNLINGLINTFITVLVPLSIYVIYQKKRYITFKNIYIFSLMVISALILGRRALLAEIIMSLIVIKVYYNVNFFEILKFNKINFFKYLILVSILFIGSSIIILDLRSSYYDLNYVPISSFDTFLDLIEKLVSGFISRSFIISYFAELISAHQYFKPLHGDELIFAFKIAIPHFLYPDKYLLPMSSEVFSHPALGIQVFDGPNSLITAGYNDFELYGAIFYPLFFIFISRLIIFLFKDAYRYINFIVIFIVFFTSMSIEVDLNAIIVVYRNMLILVIFLGFISFLSKKL
jgi:hypothetical protein